MLVNGLVVIILYIILWVIKNIRMDERTCG